MDPIGTPKKLLNKPSINRSEFDTLSPVYERHLHNVVGKNDYDGSKGSPAGQTPAVYRLFYEAKKYIEKKHQSFSLKEMHRGTKILNIHACPWKGTIIQPSFLRVNYIPFLVANSNEIPISFGRQLTWVLAPFLLKATSTHGFGLQTEETTATAQV